MVSTLSRNADNIRRRQQPDDLFYTPLEIAKIHIGMIQSKPNDLWFDPFRGGGIYYDNFPTDNRIYTEIKEGLDFFDFEGKIDIICSNPPFSSYTKIVKKCISLRPRVIALVWGVMNLNNQRLQILRDAGYEITGIHLFKVRDWFGSAFCTVFELGAQPMTGFSFTATEFKRIKPINSSHPHL